MSDEGDIDILIRTGLQNPIGVGLAKSLLQEAGIPFFTMDQNSAARQESGAFQYSANPAHQTGHLAELVCSNSFRADKLDNAVGLLKQENRLPGQQSALSAIG